MTRRPPTNLVPVALPGRLSRLSTVEGESIAFGSLDPFIVSASGPGTSRLERFVGPEVAIVPILPRPLLARSAPVAGLVWMGNLVSGPPLLRSLRCPRGLGAGLVARPRLAFAFSSKALCRSSTRALRLLSSVLMARDRVDPPTDDEWLRVDMRFSSLKMASLCAKRSRTSLYACFSSRVRDVSVLGRRMHDATVVARVETYVSSAEVRSMRRVK